MKFLNIKTLRIGTFLSLIAGGGLSGVFAIHSHDPASWGMALTAIAGAIKALLPAASISADAPVKADNFEKVGTNVSTSSTQPIVAPKVMPDGPVISKP